MLEILEAMGIQGVFVQLIRNVADQNLFRDDGFLALDEC
jgi:hypothetical protein